MKALRKYLAIFSAQVQDRLAYAGDLLTQSLTILLFMWIFLQLWQATYQSAGAEQFAGLSLLDAMWYFLIAEVVMVSKPRVSRPISQAVKDGSIAYLLNKPYDFLLYQLSVSMGEVVPRAITNLLAGGALVWLLVGAPPHLLALLWVIPAMLLAWGIDFCISALIGLAAFATEEIAPFDWIYSKFLLVAGGVLIPLDFFPDWAQRALHAMPFASIIYAPARLFVNPGLEQFFGVVAGQLFWLAVLGGLLGLLYQRSLSWLSVNGG